MNQLKKVLCLLLALVMVLGLVACGDKNPGKTTDGKDQGGKVEYVDPYADLAGNHDALSAALYKDVLGEFSTAYDAAKEEENISKRFAMMAVAEAKLMEAAIMLPTSSQGGNYAISRVAPYTISPVLWGNDMYRFHNALVATEPIKPADRDAMKAKWAELKGTDTWEKWAKDYLTGKGYTLKDSYSLTYPSDPKTWDVLATSRSADSEAIVNTYDGLMEYNTENVLKPALAESYSVSEDGKTYTFKIRPGQVWVDSQGRKVADIKADDFVAGMQHMMDSHGGLEYLVEEIIVNAKGYINGDVLDFAQVGVKALDDTTVAYTLNEPCSYFMTMLGYGVFAPMSREYYTSQGGKFGTAYDASAADYKYGSDPDHIAYCGPYLVSNATKENTIVFKANPSYWNKDGINLQTITWLFNDGSDATKAYKDTMAGVLDGAGLTAAALEVARSEGNFDKYAYVSSTNATTFSAFFNINRIALQNVADQAAKSSKDAKDVERGNAALRNAHFRRAVAFAIDRGAYNAQSVGEELKLVSLRNSYTPGTFVSMAEEITIDINGKATTYPAGTYYGKIMQDQIDADGVKMTVWDPKGDSGIGSSDSFDGWFNADNAKAELAEAVKELAAIGIEISAENPIELDLPYPAAVQSFTNKANAMKQSIEEALGGAVIVNLINCPTTKEWYNAGYQTDFGYEANYDIYDVSGWGPDYGDPSTYLDTFLPEYAGYMAKCIGIY